MRNALRAVSKISLLNGSILEAKSACNFSINALLALALARFLSKVFNSEISCLMGSKNAFHALFFSSRTYFLASFSIASSSSSVAMVFPFSAP